jgi:hypothetical protein
MMRLASLDLSITAEDGLALAFSSVVRVASVEVRPVGIILSVRQLLSVTTEDTLALAFTLALMVRSASVEIRPVGVVFLIRKLLCIAAEDTLSLALALALMMAGLKGCNKISCLDRATCLWWYESMLCVVN